MENKTIIDELKSLVGHAIEVGFTMNQEFTLRHTEGILVEVTEELIHMRLYNNYGEISNYYLNRHSCQLVSVVDMGVPKNE